MKQGPTFGESMQQVFVERYGYEMTLEEAQEFVRSMLNLLGIGALGVSRANDGPVSRSLQSQDDRANT